MMEQSGQANSEGEVRARILADLTGRFDTIVFEMEAESLAEFERRRSEMFADPQYQQDAPKMAELIDWGASASFMRLKNNTGGRRSCSAQRPHGDRPTPR
jgi:hypothetical protein